MISTLTALGNDVPTRAGAGSGNEVPAPDRGGHQGQKGHQALAGPRHRVSPTVLNLLQTARRGLAEADAEGDPGTRYICAHLAALRAAAAVVAARPATETGPRRKALKSVWELLPRVEPALAEWAAFFAAGARKRAAAEAGLPKAVTAHEADDLLRDAETFLSLAEEALGVPAQPLLPGLAPSHYGAA